MATHSSTLARKIPWTEEPGRLQSMGSLKIGHDWASSLSCIGEGNGNPLQCSCMENPRDRGAWWAAIIWSDLAAQPILSIQEGPSSDHSPILLKQRLWIINLLSVFYWPLYEKRRNRVQISKFFGYPVTYTLCVISEVIGWNIIIIHHLYGKI